MLAEGVLSRRGAPCVLTAVSQHALIATAASTVVKQGSLPHGRGELAAQYTAVRGERKPQLDAELNAIHSSKCKNFTFFNKCKLLPVVTSMAAAAAVWLSGGCDLTVWRRQHLDSCCPLFS